MRKYASKKSDIPTTAAQTAAQAVSDNPGIPMSSMRSMLMQKAMNDRSHRIDLPEAMREKMERAFGMNFGKVNLYESESVADAGANAIAQGGSIAFAPGKADFNSLDGQRRLGHELSHVAAQARGEVTGSGFLDNGALEARADREGALAASGEQAYSGPVMDAPSFAGASAPMQAEGGGVVLPTIPQKKVPKQKKTGRPSSVRYKLKTKEDDLPESVKLANALSRQMKISDHKQHKKDIAFQKQLNDNREKNKKRIQAGSVRDDEASQTFKKKPVYSPHLLLNRETQGSLALKKIGQGKLLKKALAFKKQNNYLRNGFGDYERIEEEED